MMDVTKQKDLSGFYRHLLKQQCGEEKIPDRSTSETSLIKDTKNTSLKQSFGEHSTEHGTSSQTNIARVTEPALKTRGQSNDDDHDNNNNNPDADSEFFETSSGEDDAQRKSDVQTITGLSIKVVLVHRMKHGTIIDGLLVFPGGGGRGGSYMHLNLPV